MQKKFITNLAFLLALNLLIKPFWILGIDRAVQNAVGSESYGLYYALFNFSLLLNIFLDLGITNFNSQNISKNMQLVHKHISGIVLIRILLSGLYLILSFIFGYFLGYTSVEFKMLLLLLFNQIMLSFILYLRSNLAGLHFFKLDSLVSVTDRFLMIVISAALLYRHYTDYKIEWFVYTQTAGYLITVLFTLWLLHGKITLQKLYWNPTFILLIIKKSLPYAILILLMTFYNRIDPVMLKYLLPDIGAEQSGIYAQAYRLLDAANMISYLFAGLLLPMFSHLIKRKQSVEELTKLSFSLIAVPAILMATACVFNSHNIMNLLYKHHIDESSQVFSIIICCFLAISSTYIFGTLLTANGNLKQLNTMAACGMVLNISLNFYMIPRYHALGAALSSAVTQFFAAAIQIVLSHRMFRFKVDYKLLFTFIVFAALAVMFNYVFGLYVENWLYGMIFSAVCAMIAAFAMQLISIPVIYRILKSDE